MLLKLKDNIFNSWQEGHLRVDIYSGEQTWSVVKQEKGGTVAHIQPRTPGVVPHKADTVCIPTNPDELEVSLWWATASWLATVEQNMYEGLNAFFLHTPRPGYSLTFTAPDENISLAGGSVCYNVAVRTPYGKTMPFPLLTSAIRWQRPRYVDVDYLYRQTLKRYTEEPVDILRSTIAF